MTPPRYLPDDPFPPYTFIPGRFPHPISNPAGHSYQQVRQQTAAPDADNWHASRTFLRGIDLFNHGFFWEAHEAWESLWHACGRRGVMADFLKGLIQLAAAGVKHREGVPQGVTNHARRAAELWRETAQSVGATRQRFLGLHIMKLIALMDEITANGWPEKVFLIPTEPDA